MENLSAKIETKLKPLLLGFQHMQTQEQQAIILELKHKILDKLVSGLKFVNKVKHVANATRLQKCKGILVIESARLQ